MASHQKRFAVFVLFGAAAVLISFAGCTGRPNRAQERSASTVAFTDTAWFRAHCVPGDTLHPDLTACVLRDQSAAQRRLPGTAPLIPPPPRP
ncbi:MAG TPA: hypothetical protein VM076_21115 [Gemmatimonadaceae bacterium]|nr:hypothetical protein [Gemmatimonadaceae bacterium]